VNTYAGPNSRLPDTPVAPHISLGVHPAPLVVNGYSVVAGALAVSNILSDHKQSRCPVNDLRVEEAKLALAPVCDVDSARVVV
jgi:hypothetical protein